MPIYTVTALEDETYDGGDLAAETADGSLSLREAIGLANANGATPDGITFSAGLQLLLTNGQLEITTDDITIDGDLDNNGTPDVTISAASALGAEDATSRVFLVDDSTAGQISAHLNGLVIRDGLPVDEGDPDIEGDEGLFDGGGILVGEADALILTNSTVSDNTGSFGGGIALRDDAIALLDNVIVSDNIASSGGGISAAGNFTTISLTDSTVSGNYAFLRGGGIFGIGFADITLTGSTVSGNRTSDVNLFGITVANGGGISVVNSSVTLVDSTVANNYSLLGGGIYGNLGADISLTNSTVSGNDALYYGGGIHIRAYGGFGGDIPSTLSLTNSTVAGNYAGYSGGGIASSGSALDGNNTVTLANSIVAGNAAEDPASNDLETDDTDLVLDGGNIVGDTFTEDGGSPQVGIALTDIFATVGNNPNTWVLPGTLADNGGPVQTIALDPNVNNPAIDSGDPDLLDETLTGTDLNGDGDTDDVIATDARSLPRAALGGPDLGAFEVQAITEFTVTTLDDEDYDGGDVLDEMADGGGLSLREALALANADPDANTINFDASLAGTLTLTNGELTITSDGITIDGDADITISGNNASRVFRIDDDSAATVSATLNGLVIRDGQAITGGGIFVGENDALDLTNATLSGNSADLLGGGLFNGGTATLTNTTVSGNSADFAGGGLYNNGGTVALTNTTLSGNSADFGGGILNFNGTATLTSATLSGNSADFGGGLHNSFGTATLTNSIIAGNDAGTSGDEIQQGGTLNLAGGNIVGDTFSVDGVAQQTGIALADIFAEVDANPFTNVQSGVLANNAGPVETILILEGGAAHNAGDNAALPDDPQDLDGDSVTNEALPADARGLTRMRGLTVDIGAVELQNTAPTLSGLDTPVTFLENTVNAAPQIIDADVTFTDPESNFSGGTLTVTGLLSEDTVAVRNQGTGPGEIGVSGSDVSFEGTVIGSFAGGAGSTLTVTFNAAATTAAIEVLIEHLTYANSSDNPTASRDLKITVIDAADFAAVAPTTVAEQTGAANPFDGVDVGGDSAPSFADLDGDGDLDAIVGEELGTLKYFENIGSAIAPAFTERTGAANPFDGGLHNFFGTSTPSFADLDGDGDLDAIVGEILFAGGNLNYFENTGSATAPAFIERTGTANPFNGVDVGTRGTPSFADLDGDGDLDAVVGKRDGTLLYFENTGSAIAPAFIEHTGAANPFKGVDVVFNSTPSFADLDGDGDLDAIVGGYDGTLFYLENTGSAIGHAFTERTGASNPFDGVDVGSFSAPSFADLDGDGDLDAVVGEELGTLKYFENTGAGFVLMVDVTAQNDAPTQNANTGLTLNEGASAAIAAAQLDFNDAEQADSAVTYTLDTTAANGTLWLDVDSNGTLDTGEELIVGESFTQAQIGLGQLHYTHNGGETTTDGFQFDVSDGAGGSVNDQAFAITVNPVNDAPVVANPIGPQSSPANAFWTFQFAADAFTDPDTAVLTYTAALGNGDPLPSTLSFDAGTRTFTGTPPRDFVGPLAIEVTASDGTDSVSDDFLLTVTASNPPPQNLTPNPDTYGAGNTGEIINALAGNDTVTGGLGNDFINGNDGNDTINGGGGANVLHGDGGNDFVASIGNLNEGWGDANDDQLFFVGDQNQLYGGEGNDWHGVGGNGNAVAAGAGDDWLGASGNGNTLAGQDGTDFLFAVGAGNAMHGETGNDWLGVSGNFNTLFGGADNDFLGASGNGNTLAGQDGTDFLFAVGSGNAMHGETGNDWLGVNGNNNFLFGGAGNDWLGATGNGNTLDGGAGNDTLVAGPGSLNALFVFHDGYGIDEIVGFVPGNGHVVNMETFGLADFNALLPFMSQVGADVVITINPATILTMHNVNLGTLGAAQFDLV